MALYWRLKSIPELQGMPKSAQKQTFGWAFERVRRSSLLGRVLLSESAFVGVPTIVSCVYLQPWNNKYDDEFLYLATMAPLLMFSTASIFFFCVRPISIHLSRPYIRKYLISGG